MSAPPSSGCPLSKLGAKGAPVQACAELGCVHPQLVSHAHTPMALAALSVSYETMKRGEQCCSQDSTESVTQGST